MTAEGGVDAGKRAAAVAATQLVETGMLLGLGTGSTVAFVLERLAERIKAEGLSVAGVPTSRATAERARALGIPLAELSPGRAPDLAIDGADEIERGRLALIKGLGGALVREKIVASAAKRFIVVGDVRKLVDKLGTRAPVPVEVVCFAHAATARRIERLGGTAALRRTRDGEPFVSDNGNLIYDLDGLGMIADPVALECAITLIPGVVACGLFNKLAAAAFIGAPDGTAQRLEASG
ncbi:MAG: ribose 5-phosphate isomerase A [Acetobacteraceae bacterium]